MKIFKIKPRGKENPLPPQKGIVKPGKNETVIKKKAGKHPNRPHVFKYNTKGLPEPDRPVHADISQPPLQN